MPSVENTVPSNLIGITRAFAQKCATIDKPSPLADGQVTIAVPPIIAAKLALYTAMREQNITNVALAAKLGIYESAARRILDPNHRSHISQIEKALRAVGRSLVIEDKAAA